MSTSLDHLRRAAKTLRKTYENGDPVAIERLRIHPPRPTGAELIHADFLYVIAREEGFASWPILKEAVEIQGLDRAQKIQQLKIAMHNGLLPRAQALLTETPDLADGLFALQVALLNKPAVAKALAGDPTLATQMFGPRRPMLHLAFSKWIHTDPDQAEDMIAIAELLIANGADVNDSCPVNDKNDHPLSALYGAIGFANNMGLGAWLLKNGANPNDGESLYHATELGHHEGLRLLLAHGAEPKGTNALLRALDFDDPVAIKLLLDAGADPNEFNDASTGGEPPWVIPALHQAARRMCGAQVIELLLDAGADPARNFNGATPYGFARAFGNATLAQAIEKRGIAPELSEIETILANAADGVAQPGIYVDPAQLPTEYRQIIRNILHLPGKMNHVQNLVALGLEYDFPDASGVTPVQIAGWEGLPEMLDYFLRLKPDLSHVNGYGGGLLETIIHGSENNPAREGRDYISCLRLVLEEGVALPIQALKTYAPPDIEAFLQDWAAKYPGQVVPHSSG